ncbi:MAG: DUF6252 family protein [Bacteroidota bacterium]
MKKYIFLFLLCVLGVLSSCQDDVIFNNPAFQATINNEVWKANLKSAIKERSGVMVIKGTSQYDNLELNISSSNVGTYKLGTVNQSNVASFYPVNNEDVFYSTGITEGSVNEIKLTNGGTGYTTASIVSTSGGSGTGLKVNITAGSNGVITKVEINVPGTDYLPGDVITVVAGNNNASFAVVSVSKSNGEIVITENTGATISGTFKFIAFDETTKDLISCREGVFYKLPITTN